MSIHIRHWHVVIILLTFFLTFAADRAAAFDGIEYYNRGTESLNKGDALNALLDFRRAMLTHPNLSPLKQNLEIARRRLGRPASDSQDLAGLPYRVLAPMSWKILCVICSVIWWGCVAFYPPRSPILRYATYASLSCFLLSLVMVVGAYVNSNGEFIISWTPSAGTAVVTSEASVLRSENDRTAPELALLPIGTEVELLEPRVDWVKIKAAASTKNQEHNLVETEGWVPMQDLTVIERKGNT